MTKKSHLLKEIDLSKLGNTQQAKSIEDIRSSKKDQEVSTKKQAQPAQKNNQNQTQQTPQQVSKQTKEPAQKKTTQKQEISDENFKGILDYLNKIDLSNLDENDKKLLDFISSNVKKFTNEQKVELKKNNTIIEYFINNNKISTKTATEKNIEFLVNEQDKYLMFYDDAIDNNIKNKFDQIDGNLIKIDKDFKIFVKNIIENFKNIISSSLIKQEVPILNFLQDKIFLLIEDTKGKGYEPRFICVSSNFEYSKKNKKLNFKVKIDRGETENIQSGSEYSYADNLRDEATATFSYEVPKITQLYNAILRSYNSIINDPFSLLKILFQDFNQKDNTVADEIHKAQQEKNEENRQENNQNQNYQEELKQNQESKQKVETPEEKGKDILANTVYDRNLENASDSNLNDQNLNLFIADSHFKFTKAKKEENKNSELFQVSIKNTQNVKKTNFKKLYENLSLIIKTQIRNEFVNFYNRKDDEKIENMQNYFYGKIMSSKVGDYIKSIFGERNEDSSPDLKILLLTDDEMKNISREGNFVLGQNDAKNQANQSDMSQQDFIDSFYKFQEDLFSKVIDKALNDVRDNDWKYIDLDKQGDIDKFKEGFKNNLINGSNISIDMADTNNEYQKEPENKGQEGSKDAYEDLENESEAISVDEENKNNIIKVLKIMLGEKNIQDEDEEKERKIILHNAFNNLINCFYRQMLVDSNFIDTELQNGLDFYKPATFFTSKFNPDVFLKQITDNGILKFHYNTLQKIENIEEALSETKIEDKENKIKILEDFYKKGKIINIKTGKSKEDLFKINFFNGEIFLKFLIAFIDKFFLVSDIYTSEEKTYDVSKVIQGYIDSNKETQKNNFFDMIDLYSYSNRNDIVAAYVSSKSIDNVYFAKKSGNLNDSEKKFWKSTLKRYFIEKENGRPQLKFEDNFTSFVMIIQYIEENPFMPNLNFQIRYKDDVVKDNIFNSLNFYTKIYDESSLNVLNIKKSLYNDENFEKIKSHLNNKEFEKFLKNFENRDKIIKTMISVLEKEPNLKSFTNLFRKEENVIFEYIVKKFLYNELMKSLYVLNELHRDAFTYCKDKEYDKNYNNLDTDYNLLSDELNNYKSSLSKNADDYFGQKSSNYQKIMNSISEESSNNSNTNNISDDINDINNQKQNSSQGQNSIADTSSTSDNTDSSSSTQSEEENVEQTGDSENIKIEKVENLNSKSDSEKSETRKARREQIKPIRTDLSKYCFFNPSYLYNIQYAIDSVVYQENKNSIIEKLKKIKNSFKFDNLNNDFEDEKAIQVIDNVEFKILKNDKNIFIYLNPFDVSKNLEGHVITIFLDELRSFETSQKDKIIQSIFNYIINSFEIQLNLDEITDFSKVDIEAQGKEDDQSSNMDHFQQSLDNNSSDKDQRKDNSGNTNTSNNTSDQNQGHDIEKDDQSTNGSSDNQNAEDENPAKENQEKKPDAEDKNQNQKDQAEENNKKDESTTYKTENKEIVEKLINEFNRIKINEIPEKYLLYFNNNFKIIEFNNKVIDTDSSDKDSISIDYISFVCENLYNDSKPKRLGFKITFNMSSKSLRLWSSYDANNFSEKLSNFESMLEDHLLNLVVNRSVTLTSGRLTEVIQKEDKKIYNLLIQLKHQIEDLDPDFYDNLDHNNCVKIVNDILKELDNQEDINKKKEILKNDKNSCINEIKKILDKKGFFASYEKFVEKRKYEFSKLITEYFFNAYFLLILNDEDSQINFINADVVLKKIIVLYQKHFNNVKDLQIESLSLLKIKGQKLILEEIQKSQNENTHLDFSYFKSQKKELQNLIKQYEKEEESKAKSNIEKKIKEKQREISNQITLQSIKNFVNNIKSLRNANNNNSQKLVKQMSKRLGFEPSPLEFSLQSLNKFKNMSEFSRVISNIILTNIMLQLTQLNTIYTIFSNDKIDENIIRDAFMQLENDFKRLVKSLQEKEVSSKFEELSEKISENFGTDSSVYLETKDTYEKVMSYYQKQYKSLTEFKKSLSDFWENYSKIEKEEEKINQRKNMISQFIEIRDSKEIKQIYKVYLVNNSFFNDKLKSIIDANSKLSYNEILTSHGYETFESIYQKEKQIFDKTFKKCNEVLGKSIGQGKLGKLFDDLEKIKTSLESTKPAQENKKEDNQEKSNETQNSQDKQKTELNKNNKPETENKQDKTEETSGNKTENKKIKQGLKLLNNSTELKIYQRKN